MPQLGMAQDAGRLVAWLKAPGDAVAKGEALFEVETDKATMEVEAQGDGFLTGVVAAEGDDVPVGQVIARISESADESEAAPAAPAAAEASAEAPGGDALPEGRAVTMPQLGMAQDAGLLVGWHKALGRQGRRGRSALRGRDRQGADGGARGRRRLPRRHAGRGRRGGAGGRDRRDHLAPRSPQAPSPGAGPSAGSAPPPGQPEARAAAAARDGQSPANGQRRAATAPQRRAGASSPRPRRGGWRWSRGSTSPGWSKRAIRSPTTSLISRRCARLPAAQARRRRRAAAATQRLDRGDRTDGFAAFAAWAAEAHGLDDRRRAARRASPRRASTPRTPAIVAIERFGAARDLSPSRPAAASGSAEAAEDAPHLVLRDLRGTALRGVELGAEDAPVLTLDAARRRPDASRWNAAPAQLDAQAAIRFSPNSRAGLEQPLRHLL